MSAVSYVGSYLSRARFISLNNVVALLKRWLHSVHTRTFVLNTSHSVSTFYAFVHLRFMLCYVLRLVDWCEDYFRQLDKGLTANPIKHQLFYASCQVCYALFSVYLTKQEKLVKMHVIAQSPLFLF